MSTSVGRYAGRLDGPGVDDTVPGPEAIATVLRSDIALIHDPMSFAWGSADISDWRTPTVIDLSACSENDLVALAPELVVLTPEDRVIASSTNREQIETLVALPPESVLVDPPEDWVELVEDARPAKLRRALLREILEPIITVELTVTAGIGDAATRPLIVADIGAPNQWRATLVVSPHQHVVHSRDETRPDSASIVLLDGDSLDIDALRGARETVVPGGLILAILPEQALRSTGPDGFEAFRARIDEAFGSARTIDEVWGLHESPGFPTLGAVIGIRPMGAS